MHLLNPFFAIPLILVAVLLVRATFCVAGGHENGSRFGTIDGLRGYLAFFVFLHHATIWHAYIQGDVWSSPASHFYNHLGQSSVALFFMITSFLFYEKLLNTKFDGIAWRAFFINRLFRLMPLYAAVMFVMVVIVAKLAHWTLNERPGVFIGNVMQWLLFSIPGVPKIDHVDPFFIVAGVTWSLPYEWCFYLLLPLIALTTGQRAPWQAFALSGIGLATAWFINMKPEHLIMFGGGLVAARLVRSEQFRTFSRTPFASAVVLACLAVVLIFPTPFQFVPCLCLIAAFCLIAGGTDLFGILLGKTSRRLGELAYSIYLVHGILLFVMINFVVGKANIATMSGTAYWSCIALLVPCLLAVCACTYRYIERPGISLGKKLASSWSAMEAVKTHTSIPPEDRRAVSPNVTA